MLGPGDFTTIVLGLIGLAVVGVLLVGWIYRRESSTAPSPRPRRDPIAEGKITEHEVNTMLDGENARLRAHGRSELSRGELESRLVGNRKFLFRLMRLRLRRHPERAPRLP
jgi:hypothetical protein